MLVHYIWIGAKQIPSKYLDNFNNCLSLNPSFEFKIWRDEECLDLITNNNLFEYWSKLSFICKYNLIKYLILDKFGGIYTDFDINWKLPFEKILPSNYNNIDIFLSAKEYTIKIQIDGNQFNLLDDPFIFSKPNLFGSCIEYCMNRTELKHDGDLYVNTGQLIIHKAEPIGPFGLTEWVYKKKINVTFFSQEKYLDSYDGIFGLHEQNMTWQ